MMQNYEKREKGCTMYEIEHIHFYYARCDVTRYKNNIKLKDI